MALNSLSLEGAKPRGAFELFAGFDGGTGRSNSTGTFRVIACQEISMSTKPVNVNRGRFANALGEAVLECWAELSQDTQHMIFEKAVVCGHHDERDESLREQLAEYLHDHHPRTEK